MSDRIQRSVISTAATAMIRQFRSALRPDLCTASALLVLFLLSARAFSSGSPDTTKPGIYAARIEGSLRMTGDLDDPRWQTARSVELAVEAQPGENIPASQKTYVKVLYNTETVYFGFDCRDTDLHAIRAHISDRDRIFDDDFVIILLDTYGDSQRAYEFCVNPYGIQADLLRYGTNEDDSFDTVWETAAVQTTDGWTAVMAIPFKSIRFPATAEQKWSLSIARIFPRDSRMLLSWTPIDRNNPCLQCQGGTLYGITGVQSTSSVEMLPYAVSQQSGEVRDDSDPASPFENGKPRVRIGGGVRYAPTPDLAIEAVVNPDFSQIESDATQISVNSTFALFYSERRPFFLLGADMFKNQTGTFYSRAINNPFGGVRVIGKTGALSFSCLTAVDRNTPYIVPGDEGSDLVQTDMQSISNVARARYDFGNESYLGGMITARNTNDAHNFTGGIDWNYKFMGNNSFRGEVFLSDTREVKDTVLLSNSRRFGWTDHDATFNGEWYQGVATAISLRHEGRDYSGRIQYQDRTPTFQAHNGFVPGNDARYVSIGQWYTFYPNTAVVEYWTSELEGGLHFNHAGLKKEQWLEPNVFVQFKGQVGVSVNYMLINDEIFRGVQFRNMRRFGVEINSRPMSALSFSIHVNLGRFLNRSDTPSLGTGHTIDLEAQILPTSQLKVELGFSRARLSDIMTGALFFDGYIARTVCVYQFTPEFLVRLIGQYDQFNRKIDIYPLISYKLNPYTIFYAGSTYSLTDYGYPFGVQQTARQYFLKLQYLWRT